MPQQSSSATSPYVLPARSHSGLVTGDLFQANTDNMVQLYSIQLYLHSIKYNKEAGIHDDDKFHWENVEPKRL